MSKSLGAHTPFSKKLIKARGAHLVVVLALLMGVSSNTCLAETKESNSKTHLGAASLSQEDLDAISNIAKANQIDIDASEKHDFNMEDFSPSQSVDSSFLDDIEKIYQDSLSNNESLKHSQEKKERDNSFIKEHNTFVFISRSLGENGLKDMFSSLTEKDDVVFVLRGIREGEKIDTGLLSIQRLSQGYDPEPKIILDPVLFRDYNITHVPTIIITDPESEEIEGTGNPSRVIASVQGLTNHQWLLDKIKNGETGDQGVRGPIEDISEPDLIEVMKQKVAAIDWDEKKQKAIDNFWSNQSFNYLAPATKNKERVLDPTVMVMRDITAPDGTKIASEGQLINPLEMRAFPRVMVVFNPLDKKGMRVLDQQLPLLQQNNPNKTFIFIATQFDQDKGWDSYTEIIQKFDAPVYLLTSDVKERFQLQRTPSIVTADEEKKVFIINELAGADTVESSGEKQND